MRTARRWVALAAYLAACSIATAAEPVPPRSLHSLPPEGAGPARERPGVGPTWPDVKVTLQAQQRPLRSVLQDLFGSVGLRVSLSEGVSGTVSGRLSDSPRAIFDDLVRSHNLLPYFDGAVMHVAAAAELVGKSIAIAPDEGRALLATMNRQRMLDGQHSAQLIADAGLIKVRGSPMFVQEVEDLINARRLKPAPAQALASPAASPGPAAAAAVAPPAPAVPQVVRSFALRYASAADLVLYQSGKPVTVPGMATMLAQMVGDGSAASTAVMQPAGAGAGNTVEKLRGRGLRRYGAPEAYETQASASAVRADAAPPLGRGATRIAADRTLNAVVVRDRADAMPMYEQLIAELDKAPQLIEIQVTIIEVDRNRLSDIGVDWRYQDARTTAQAGGGAGITPDLGGLLFNTVIGDLQRFLARINALAADGAARITSRPQVLTISNMEALVSDDKSFYVRVAGQQDVDLFNVTAGTSLRVVPFVVGDAASPQVRLTVTIEDGAISGQAAVDGIPAVDRSSLNTQAVVGSGQNLLLGGLVRERDERRVDKVPLLGDAPVIGPLFRRTVENNSRTERLYLITPRVLPAQGGAMPPPPSRDPLGARPLPPPALVPQSPAPQPSTQPVLAPTQPAQQSAPRPRPFMDLEPMPVAERGRG